MGQGPIDRYCSFLDFVYDADTCRLRRGTELRIQQEVPARFLEVLLRAAAKTDDPNGPERYVDYATLRQAIWGSRAVNDNAIQKAASTARVALGDGSLIVNTKSSGYHFAGPRPVWTNTLSDVTKLSALVVDRPIEPTTPPARVRVLWRSTLWLSIAVVLATIVTAFLLRASHRPDAATDGYDPAQIVFVSATPSTSNGPSGEADRDVSEEVFEAVSERLTHTQRSHSVEGCDWLCLFVPRFPDELLEPTPGVPSHAYPLPMSPRTQTLEALAKKYEKRPTLRHAGGALTTAGVLDAADSRQGADSHAGSTHLPRGKTVSCRIRIGQKSTAALAIRVFDSNGAASFVRRIEKPTEREAIVTAAEELVTALWPLHSALVRYTEAYDRVRPRNCIPLRTEGILPFRDPLPFGALLLELQELGGSPDLTRRSFAWVLQGIFYLHCVRDPESAESTLKKFLRCVGPQPRDAATSWLRQDAFYELALARYARRDWQKALNKIGEAIIAAETNGAELVDLQELRRVQAIIKLRIAKDLAPPAARVAFVRGAWKALSDFVGADLRTVSPQQRVTLSQLEYLYATTQLAGERRADALRRARRIIDELVGDFPGNYNLRMWQLRLHRLVASHDTLDALVRDAVTRFPEHAGLMIEAATSALDAGDLRRATWVADQAAAAFNSEVHDTFQTQPRIATALWRRPPQGPEEPIPPLAPRLALSRSPQLTGETRGASQTVLSTSWGLEPEREEIDLHLLRARILHCENRDADAHREIRRATEVAATAHVLVSAPCESGSAAECLERLECGRAVEHPR